MERIVNSNIITRADKQNILNQLKGGFLKVFSCETQLLEFINDV